MPWPSKPEQVDAKPSQNIGVPGQALPLRSYSDPALTVTVNARPYNASANLVTTFHGHALLCDS